MLYQLTHSMILPPASLFLLLAAGIVIRRYSQALGRAIAAGAILLLYLLCTDLGRAALVTPLERLTQPLAGWSGNREQAIVVLAAGRLPDAPEYGDRDIPDMVALARLRYAAHLYRMHPLPILVSGGNGSISEGVAPKAIGMASALRGDFGVPVKWVEGHSENTDENASRSREMLQPEGVRRIVLVTDAMHMRRAVMAFKRYGFEVTPAPTMFLSEKPVGPLFFVPGVENLRESCYAVYEWLGLAWYAVRFSASAAV